MTTATAGISQQADDLTLAMALIDEKMRIPQVHALLPHVPKASLSRHYRKVHGGSSPSGLHRSEASYLFTPRIRPFASLYLLFYRSFRVCGYGVARATLEAWVYFKAFGGASDYSINDRRLLTTAITDQEQLGKRMARCKNSGALMIIATSEIKATFTYKAPRQAC